MTKTELCPQRQGHTPPSVIMSNSLYVGRNVNRRFHPKMKYKEHTNAFNSLFVSLYAFACTIVHGIRSHTVGVRCRIALFHVYTFTWKRYIPYTTARYSLYLVCPRCIAFFVPRLHDLKSKINGKTNESCDSPTRNDFLKKPISHVN